MLNVSPAKFVWTFLVAFFFCANLNWGIAAFLLNDWTAPRLDGFLRTGEAAASGLNIARMTLGFMLPLFVACWWYSTIERPVGWFARALYAGSMVSLAAFFGTYTFISGWGNVNWWPLMVTAVADTASIVPGTILLAWLQQRGASG